MRSTASKVAARQLLNLLSATLNGVTSQNNGEATDVTYLNYTKTFDSVFHSKLLHKLYVYGIRDDLLKWFENFLSSRTQAMTINGVLSDFLSVTIVVSFKGMCAAHNCLKFILTFCRSCPASS